MNKRKKARRIYLRETDRQKKGAKEHIPYTLLSDKNVFFKGNRRAWLSGNGFKSIFSLGPNANHFLQYGNGPILLFFLPIVLRDQTHTQTKDKLYQRCLITL